MNNKSILVTGASSGIGRKTACTISQKGGFVFLLARNEERLVETQQQLKSDSAILQCDLTDEDQLSTCIESIEKLDGLVLCAGVNEYVPVKSISKKRIDKIFDTNFNSQILLIQKLLKKKKFNNGASIVFVSSLSSLMGVPATLLYSASKAAINSAVKVLASELAPQKIRVNSICPGIIKTEMLGAQNIDESLFLEQEKMYPLGLGTTEDVANAVIFHLSDASKWLTGNIMVLDGGFSLNK